MRKMCNWRTCLTSVQNWFLLGEDETGTDRYSLKQLAREAGEELKQAYELLERMTEPDMVDYAVYRLKAAEKRYDYMIKKMREHERTAVALKT